MDKKFDLVCICLLLMLLSSCSTVEEKNPFVSSSVEISSDEGINYIKSKSPEELIGRAKTAYGWFAMVPLEVEYDLQKEIDGVIYYKVADDRYDTREKLDEYLHTIFSNDIIKGMWGEYPIYKELDGFLYCTDGGRGQDIFIEDERYDAEEISDDKVVYTVTVTYSPESGEDENPREYEFVMEKIDNNWVFTSFPFYW